MPRVDLTLSVDVERTPRVTQMEGIFDMPEKKRTTVDFHFDVPIEEKDWRVGLIVGPSGGGKSSVARHLFKDAIVDGYEWHPSQSVVDGFGNIPIKEITSAMSAVGFSSPPDWVKPFRVLSNGQQFRATLARVLTDERELLVVDEFTSVVDRTVARIGAHAVAKAIRSQANKRFVAVTCHEDVLEWLQPDWVLEPHIGRFSWRSPRRRPGIDIEIIKTDVSAWPLFRPHHYMSADIHRAARCWMALIDGKPAAFTSVLPFPHPKMKNARRFHRTVVLPDFQGAGIGNSLCEWVGSMLKALRFRVIATAAHPSLIKSRARSTQWQMTRKPSLAQRHTDKAMRSTSNTWTRKTASFEFVGAPMTDVATARLMYG